MIKSVKLNSGIISGCDFIPIEIEVSAIPSNALKISVIGLNTSPDIKNDMITRIKAALFNTNFSLTKSNYIISILSTNAYTSCTHLDLPICLGLLYINNHIPYETINALKRYNIFGELSLDGTVLPSSSLFALALGTFNMAINRGIFTSSFGYELMEAVPYVEVSFIHRLSDIIKKTEFNPIVCSKKIDIDVSFRSEFDMSFIKGMEIPKRVIEIAVSGDHHCVLYGAPGSGKTLLAKTAHSIMPFLSGRDLMETNYIYSSAGELVDNKIMMIPPFRSPHHSSSIVGLVGGGKRPYPGDVTFAHNGILFLDELLEFSTPKLEMLRQVLEDRKISIKKDNYSVTYPASFTLISAFNPCPCGYYITDNKKCSCSLLQIKNYLSKLSGPFRDRLDLQLFITPVTSEELKYSSPSESSSTVRERVKRTIEIQTDRYGTSERNGSVSFSQFEEHAKLSPDASKYVESLINKMSMRSHNKIIRVARTIADIDQSEFVTVSHILESLKYRTLESLDRMIGM